MKKTLCAVLALALLAGLITALALPASAQGAASDTSVSFHNCDEPVSGTTVDTELKTEGSGSWIVNMGAMMVVYNFDPIDVSEYDSLEFDLWVESTDFDKLTGDTQMELSSSTKDDEQEVGWITKSILLLNCKEPGWHHVTLAFADGGVTGGAPDYTRINHIRFYWVSSSETISARIDNIRFTKAALEAQRRAALQAEIDLAGDLFNGCNDLEGVTGAELSETVFKTGTGAWKITLGGGKTVQATFPETDMSQYERLELDLWVLDADDVAALGGASEIELTSSGGCDANELHWYPSNVLTGLKDGWNHVVIDLASGGATGGEIDLTKVNYFRWYWVETSGEVQAYLDNIRLMKSTDEYLERETFSFMVFEESEDDYLVRSSAGKNAQKRFSDADKETVYKFTTEHPKGARRIVFTAKVGSQFLLQVSTDDTHWTEVYRWTTDEITETTDGSKFSKGLGAGVYSYDLTDYLDLSDGTRTIYVRIADAYPTVNGVTNGWGGNIYTGVEASLTIDYAAVDEAVTPTDPPVTPGETETAEPGEQPPETTEPAGTETETEAAPVETSSESSNHETEAGTDAPKIGKKGCGSVIGFGILSIGLCVLGGTALAIRKKD